MLGFFIYPVYENSIFGVLYAVGKLSTRGIHV